MLLFVDSLVVNGESKLALYFLHIFTWKYFIVIQMPIFAGVQSWISCNGMHRPCAFRLACCSF